MYYFLPEFSYNSKQRNVHLEHYIVFFTLFIVLHVCFVDRCLSFWSLCCLSFDLQILITPVVSSNSSCNISLLMDSYSQRLSQLSRQNLSRDMACKVSDWCLTPSENLSATSCWKQMTFNEMMMIFCFITTFLVWFCLIVLAYWNISLQCVFTLTRYPDCQANYR